MNVYLLITIILIVFEKIVCENPYRILGIAPYSSIEDVKNECKKLMKIYHPDKFKGDKDEARVKFDRIQKACKEIKDSRPDEKEGESGINNAIYRCIKSIILSAICITIFYYFSMFLYKFSAYTLKFSILGTITFLTIEFFFAHFFESEENQYGFSFLLTILLSSSESIKNYFYGKKSDVKMCEEKKSDRKISDEKRCFKKLYTQNLNVLSLIQVKKVVENFVIKVANFKLKKDKKYKEPEAILNDDSNIK